MPLPCMLGLREYPGGAARLRCVRSTPPHVYQVLLRVALARRLTTAGHSLGRVAVDAGFAAQRHMHRHFTRMVGVTPGAYRRAGGSGAPGARKIVEDCEDCGPAPG